MRMIRNVKAVFVAMTMAGGLAFAGDAAASIVYNVNLSVGGGGVVGSITTNGKIGVLSASDITAWDLVLTGKGGVTYHLVSGGSGTTGTGGTTGGFGPPPGFPFDAGTGGFGPPFGSPADAATGGVVSGVEVGNISDSLNPNAGTADLTADATHIYFNFDGTDGGYFGFQTLPFYGGQHYWCLASQNNNFDCSQGISVAPVLYSDPSAFNVPTSGNQIIATVAGAGGADGSAGPIGGPGADASDASGAGASIVYNVNLSVGGGSVVGSITTDGKYGVLSASDIIAWDLVLTGKGGVTYHLVSGGSGVLVGNISAPMNPNAGTADLTADATNIYFNFDGTDGGYLGFQPLPLYGGQHYWCCASKNNNYDCSQGISVVPLVYNDPSAFNVPTSENQIIATVGGTGGAGGSSGLDGGPGADAFVKSGGVDAGAAGAGGSGAAGATGGAGPPVGSGGSLGTSSAASAGGSPTDTTAQNQKSSGCSCRLGAGNVRRSELGWAVGLFLVVSGWTRRQCRKALGR